jgi:hypothetical protein
MKKKIIFGGAVAGAIACGYGNWTNPAAFPWAVLFGFLIGGLAAALILAISELFDA